MAARLVAQEGPLKGLVLSFDEEGNSWVVGRDPTSCQLLIEDPKVSRKHLLCYRTEEGIYIDNMSNSTPVMVNGQVIERATPLCDGDEVVIGSCLYRFQEGEEEEPLFEERKGREGSNEREQVMKEDHEEIFSGEELSEEAEFHRALGSSHGAAGNREARREEHLLADIDYDLLDAGRWLLKVIGGPNTGAEFAMNSGHHYTIGSDPKSCDVVFNDTSVSRAHLRLSISADDIITVEELNSRNGTLVDGEKLSGKRALEPNLVVNLGTSAFVIYDREGEMQTIISPLLPSIVKVLQQEGNPLEEKDALDEEAMFDDAVARVASESVLVEEELGSTRSFARENSGNTLTAFIFIAIITGLFVIMGIAVVTLFQTTPVIEKPGSDSQQLLAEALAPFPGVEHTFNRSTGTLMLVGHVLTDAAKRQLRYNLDGLQFIRNIDDTGIVIDEKVWQELNPILARNPAWRGVTLQATAPKQFVLSGYLKTRQQMESLVDYMTANFLYLNLLQYRVTVEEDLAAKTRLELSDAGFNNINVSVSGGDVTLQGVIPQVMHDAYEKVLREITSIPGVRNVQDFVTEVKEDRSTVDITDRYIVSGVSRTGSNVSVVIDGRIVSKGDILDGMTITEVTRQAVFLQGNGVNYRIDLRP